MTCILICQLLADKRGKPMCFVRDTISLRCILFWKLKFVKYSIVKPVTFSQPCVQDSKSKNSEK